jgi:cytidylate kinase
MPVKGAKSKRIGVAEGNGMSRSTPHVSDYREGAEQLAEQNMRRWLLKQKIAERRRREHAVDRLASQLGPYIALSRAAGAGGSEIARLVGQKLNWDVLDHELLDLMADRYHASRTLLDFVDETKANWIYEVFGDWLSQKTVSQEAYVHRLGKIVLLAAHHGRIVFVGRGAQYLLPREMGLAVRIVAPLDFRIRQVMDRFGVAHDDAREQVEETDRGRQAFIRRYFRREDADPANHDLTINVEKLGQEGAASIIVEANRLRLESGPLGEIRAAVSQV